MPRTHEWLVSFIFPRWTGASGFKDKKKNGVSQGAKDDRHEEQFNFIFFHFSCWNERYLLELFCSAICCNRNFFGSRYWHFRFDFRCCISVASQSEYRNTYESWNRSNIFSYRSSWVHKTQPTANPLNVRWQFYRKAD